MYTAKTCLWGILITGFLATCASVQAQPGWHKQGLCRIAEKSAWLPPSEELDEPPPPPDRGRGRGMSPDRPRGRGREAERRHRPEAALLRRLLPLIAERHPELAERLEQLREESPQEFRQVLADALAMRLEEALDMHEPASAERFGRREGPPPRPREKPKWRERRFRERDRALDRQMEELRRRDEQLDHRSREIARHLRQLRQRGAQRGAEQDEVHSHLQEALQEHFNVRTELREIELRRIEMELERLKKAVERVRRDLEQREQTRDVIIERRMQQLLSDEQNDW